MVAPFFSSWDLWEQMTFVLGVAIFGVFCVGYGKLIWRNKLVKKQEVADEEKRIRIQELRTSGQIIESRKSHDIPFGVRAIQSGIQVEGIWISTTSIPIPSEINLENGSGTSGTTATSGSSMSGQAGKTSQQGGRSNLKGKGSARSSIDRTFEDATGSDATGARQSYKPLRESHLRYSSYGDSQFNEETLEQLGGNSTPKKKIYTHRPRGSRNVDREADSSSVADNEHSSGTSSDSDATLSGNRILVGNKQYQSSAARDMSHGEEATVLTKIPSGKPIGEYFPFRGSKGQYSSVPIDPPTLGGADPYSDPSRTSMDCNQPRSHDTWAGEESRVSQETQPARQSRDPSPPPFVPGELHINKSVRKVNSGFQVLPAGTFGVPAELQNVDLEGRYNPEYDSTDRRQSKLQKKRRSSIIGRRISGT
ncbi:uncharacterized protein BP5553_02064 [Venustampulla echinocandica]|uniref:Uncharacterized protein n=1 Tax=Venustampulla echinocandica TaxID=2656787 RepID=A0A370U2V1_9HELO|nr:uncharacterized protein BP5553_02064 [Venustampulla echinocandica]RDL42085.1 hypothetical protein BP5553_02064 [Venustampulla echinocandica]